MLDVVQRATNSRALDRDHVGARDCRCRWLGLDDLVVDRVERRRRHQLLTTARVLGRDVVRRIVLLPDRGD